MLTEEIKLTDTATLLFRAHERQILRKGAMPGNLGWVVADRAYVSKTDKGRLKTTFVQHGVYNHTWYDHESGLEIEPPPDNPGFDYRQVVEEYSKSFDHK
jgi:hypothetical protein